MAKIRVGINGFGRIGRCTFKQLFQDDDFEIVGINDLADLGDLAYLLKYDSVHGWYPEKVETPDGELEVGGLRIPFFSEKDPARIPWGDAGADVVIEVDRCVQEPGTRRRRTSKAARSVSSSPRRRRTPTAPSCRASTTRATTRRSTRSSPWPPAPPTAWRRWRRC